MIRKAQPYFFFSEAYSIIVCKIDYLFALFPCILYRFVCYHFSDISWYSITNFSNASKTGMNFCSIFVREYSVVKKIFSNIQIRLDNLLFMCYNIPIILREVKEWKNNSLLIAWITNTVYTLIRCRFVLPKVDYVLITSFCIYRRFVRILCPALRLSVT